MEKKIDIAALGELLIDFTQAGVSKDGKKLFEQNPGGAPANLLTAASHMGLKTEFIGKIGADMHGDYLKETIENEGIGTKSLIQAEDVFTTLAFVAINAETGEREFSFARKPGADTCLEIADLDQKVLEECKIMHFGSLSLTDDPARQASFEAVKKAKEAGAIISYDPNYRAPLWKSEQDAIEMMSKMIPFADVMKVSDEESLLITGESDYQKAAERILEMGPSIVAVTLGSKGVLLVAEDNSEIVPGFKVKAVDTTGAGDSFWGGFLSMYLKYEKSLEEMEWSEWKKCASYGNAVAGLCVQKRGGIPAIPSKEEVEQFLNEMVKME